MEPSLSDSKNQAATQFMTAFKKVEQGGDPKSLIELFSEGAEYISLTKQHLHYPDVAENTKLNAAQFWKNYLRAFEHIETHFTNVIASDDQQAVILEWRAAGALLNALPIEFNGISILELEALGGDEGKTFIKKLKVYYDSAAFLPHAPRAEKQFSESVGLPEITNQATS